MQIFLSRSSKGNQVKITHICSNTQACEAVSFRLMTQARDIEFLRAFGVHLRSLRTAKGWSQEMLAYNADLSLSQIGRIERGEINPTISTVRVLAETLKVPVAEMFLFN
jgi:ribosome-binding protein aMBF1 (putative translation factor)